MSDKDNEGSPEPDEAHQEMRRFEERDELPTDLKEWPEGKAKNVTFGAEADEPYGEGVNAKLGPEIRHNEDGSVTADGERVENPEDYKGKKIRSPIEEISEEQAAKDE